ncbi:MAG: glycosyltransferase [Terracidiphilus sp.]
MIDLAVAYRIYPGVSKSPAFFSADKFRLSEMCLQSFKRALGGLNVKIWALLDGCPPDYEALFRDTLQGCELKIISLNKIGNFATFSQQIDLLTSQKEAPYVYFAEDDYFYLPDALEKMVTFMRENRDADFVTPYDHPDSYYTTSRFERHFVRPFGDCYWRTASSTCLTFLTSRENLIRTQAMFRTFCRGNYDCSLWLALTQKLSLANPRVYSHDLLRMKIWAKTWIFGINRILFGRQYRLWAPLPALATHMESGCLAPLVDWQNEFQRTQKLESRLN